MHKNSSNIDWSEVYNKESGKLLSICRRYTGDNQIAEDILHDGFIKAMQNISSFKNNGVFEGWLRQIIINTALSYLKEQKKQQLVDIEEDTIPQETPTPQNASVLKDKVFNASFTTQELLEVIDQLPVNQKTVFNLYVIDGFKHKEISSILNISESVSKSTLSRSRKRIQDILADKLEQNKNSNKKRIVAATILTTGAVAQSFGMDTLFQDSFKNHAQTSNRTFNPTSGAKFTSHNQTIFKSLNATFKAKMGSIIGIGAAASVTIGIVAYNYSSPETKNISTTNAIKDTVEMLASIDSVNTDTIITQIESPIVLANKKQEKSSIENSNQETLLAKEKTDPISKNPIDSSALIKNTNTTKNNIINKDSLSKPEPTLANKKVIIKKKVYIQN